ncbi:MAG TPA: sulfatase-like hydrolase/transferase [Stellaceae bacterium]|nr:sulfatase-like hydrolase/transferase [Stellaceae bacterium]
MKCRRRFGPGAGQAALAALAALVLLLALFTPASDAESHRPILDWRPALEILVLAAALALLGLAGWRLPRSLRALLALALLLAALLHLVDALMPGLFGRQLDLYWDLGLTPSVIGLFYESTSFWRAALAITALAIGLVAAFAAILAALWAIEWAAAHRRFIAVAMIVLAITAGVLVAPPSTTGASAPISTSLTREFAEQASFLHRAWQIAHGNLGPYVAALAEPQRDTADLAKLKQHDVLLIYLESYGTAALDNPAYRAAIEPALARFTAKTERAGYMLLSSRILSPTFGGSSWLAHGTMASGIKLDQLLSRLVLESDRRSLPRYMAATGYRTVAVMPGIKTPWPEGKFWGFEKSYYAEDLDYRGPEFGWFRIPDQYTLKKFATRENHADGRPLFAQIVLVSSHTPFYPVPPYTAAWADAGDYVGVSPAEWERIYRQPDWNNLAAPYLEAVAYDLDVLGGFLTTRVADGALVIILGDHQPPAFISGEKQPWTVPIYVLSKDAELLAPFAALGYQPGAIPEQTPPYRGMESFLADFLDGFSTDGNDPAKPMPSAGDAAANVEAGGTPAPLAP